MNYGLAGLTHYKGFVPLLTLKDDDIVDNIIQKFDFLGFKCDTKKVIDYKTDGPFETGYVSVIYLLLDKTADVSIDEYLIHMNPGDLIQLKYKALKYQIKINSRGRLVKYGELRE